MLTRELIIDTTQNTVKDILIRKGYTIYFEESSDVHKCYKHYSWGHDYTVLPHIRFEPEKFLFNIHILRRINLIEELWQDYSSMININYLNQKDAMTIGVSFKSCFPEIKNESYFDSDFNVIKLSPSKSDIERLPHLLDFIINEKFIPTLEKFQNIHVLDNNVNNVFQYDEELHNILVNEGLIFRRIILAKLAGNPKYEELCEFMRSTFDFYNQYSKNEGYEYFKNYPIVFEKVYERLKSIKPLSNPVLI